MKFRAREMPAVVEARQLTPDTVEDVVGWVGDCAYWGPPYGGAGQPQGPAVFIKADDDEVRAYEGDWVIRDPHGEFGVYTADVFNAMYEPA